MSTSTRTSPKRTTASAPQAAARPGSKPVAVLRRDNQAPKRSKNGNTAGSAQLATKTGRAVGQDKLTDRLTNKLAGKPTAKPITTPTTRQPTSPRIKVTSAAAAKTAAMVLASATPAAPEANTQDKTDRRSLQLARDIRAYIAQQGMAAGDALPSESYFQETFQASRTVVREAFQQLAALHLLDIGNGRRARVARVDSHGTSMLLEHGLRTTQFSLLQIYDVRRTIEMRVASLAATLRSQTQAEQIRRCAGEMQQAFSRGDVSGVMEHDLRLHAQLAEASHNPVYVLLLRAFEGIIRDAWPKGWQSRRSEAERGNNVATHIAIAKAVQAGEPQRAADLMAAHFDDSTRALLLAGLS